MPVFRFHQGDKYVNVPGDRTMPDLEMGQATQIGLYLASGCILGSAVIEDCPLI